MKSLKMQPTFTLDVPLSTRESVARMREAIRTAGLAGNTDAAGTCIDFKIDAEQQRFWSPHLSVQFSDTDDGSQLFARYSPRPEIWTMVMAIYAVVTITMLAALIYGYVQWFLGQSPWAFAMVPFGMLLIGSLHAASLVGQSLSADQMELLRDRLDQVIRIALESDQIRTQSEQSASE
tara:strand:- start:42084 stop:42617 length:534 start_codon:yes stop_codon:yes gene_type:complete